MVSCQVINKGNQDVALYLMLSWLALNHLSHCASNSLFRYQAFSIPLPRAKRKQTKRTLLWAVPKVTPSPWQQKMAQQQITCQSKHLVVSRAHGSERKLSGSACAERINKWRDKLTKTLDIPLLIRRDIWMLATLCFFTTSIQHTVCKNTVLYSSGPPHGNKSSWSLQQVG